MVAAAGSGAGAGFAATGAGAVGVGAQAGAAAIAGGLSAGYAASSAGTARAAAEAAREREKHIAASHQVAEDFLLLRGERFHAGQDERAGVGREQRGREHFDEVARLEARGVALHDGAVAENRNLGEIAPDEFEG